MKVSVIIVAYRNAGVLKRSLDSFAEFNDLGGDAEVIVVDNSPEGERVLEGIRDAKYRDFRYIPADNRGFGAGNNMGAKAASGEILCFMNPDIIYIEPVFGKAVRLFEENPDLALFGGKLLQEDGSPGFSFFYDYASSLRQRVGEKIRNRRDSFDPRTMFTSGADLFVRKDAFFRAGMFDENIFMYFEEMDLIRRIRRAVPGARNEYRPEIRMIHLERQSTPRGTKAFGIEMESAVYYGKKYGLDYEKKIRFEWKYLKLKMRIPKFLKREQIWKLGELKEFMEKEYGEIIFRKRQDRK